ncbi:MAG: hypothetical protein QNL62_14065 [Gammaproteobacteria bacterium]|nr:hypothetical protein [Gammaproteobacteria bacterium]
MSQMDEATILVDAHVHIYDCFELNIMLDAALQNFSKAANDIGQVSEVIGVLLLTETRSYNWFQQTRDVCIRNQSLPASEKGWEIQLTPDSTVLQAKQKNDGQADGNLLDDMQIYIVAGRQIVTAEGLELLALATDGTFEDGLPVSSALAAVCESGAIPVFPWAVGKWLGKRGKILATLLSHEPPVGLCLGDNSGRPVFWRNPSHFKQARALNMHILPGTDPLPFANEAKRVGSYGFTMQGSLSDAHPAADLKRLLQAMETKLLAYGRLEKSWRFLANQIRLRLA